MSQPMKLCICLSLIGLVIAASCCSAGYADVISVRGEKDRKAVITYKMTITPAAQPVPAFKHRLTVRDIDKIPGNAITHYLRSLGENSLDSPLDYLQKTYGVEVYGWSGTDMPAKEVPLDKLRDACSKFDGYVNNHLRRATLCRDSDWGLAEDTLRGRETISFLLPSIQQTRSMARVLVLRNRLAVMDGRFEDSVDHLRMTYTLGQNASKMKFLVAKLVGIAEIGMANDGMLHLISAKGSPNMYWALAELPQPIVSIRDAVRLEASFAIRYFPVLMDVETAQHSPEQWKEKLTQLFDSFEEVFGLTGQRRSQFGIPGKFFAGLSGYTAAKKRLVEQGMDTNEVEKMAVAHVVLLDAARDYQRYADSVEASYYLPLTNFRSFSDRMNKKMREEKSPGRLGAMLASLFLPAMVQVRNAEVRIQTEISGIQAIEAIRDYVASNGEFPPKLDDMELPVRLNPTTGKPFGYKVDGDRVILEVEGGNFDTRYEIKIAPGK